MLPRRGDVLSVVRDGPAPISPNASRVGGNISIYVRTLVNIYTYIYIYMYTYIYIYIYMYVCMYVCVTSKSDVSDGGSSGGGFLGLRGKCSAHKADWCSSNSRIQEKSSTLKEKKERKGRKEKKKKKEEKNTTFPVFYIRWRNTWLFFYFLSAIPTRNVTFTQTFFSQSYRLFGESKHGEICLFTKSTAVGFPDREL